MGNATSLTCAPYAHSQRRKRERAGESPEEEQRRKRQGESENDGGFERFRSEKKTFFSFFSFAAMSARSRFAALAGRLAASLTAPSTASASCCSAAASMAASTSYASATFLLNHVRSFANPGIRVPVNRNQVRLNLLSSCGERTRTARSDRVRKAEKEALAGDEINALKMRLFGRRRNDRPSFRPRPPPLHLIPDSSSSSPTHLNRSTAPYETSTASARPTTSLRPGAPTGSSHGRPSGASSRPRPRRGGSPRGGSRLTCAG